MGAEPIFEQAWDAFTSHMPHHYSETDTTPEVPPVNLINLIEDDIKSVGGMVDEHVHAALAKHLTFSQMAAEVAGKVAAVEASPLAQLGERLALGPAGEQALAEGIGKFASLFPPAVADPQTGM